MAQVYEDISERIKAYVRDTMEDTEEVTTNLNRVKVKIISDDQSWRSETKSEPRVVDLNNRTNEDGEGHIEIVKKGKPYCHFTIEEGVFAAFPNHVEFVDPSRRAFLAKINQPNCVLDDRLNLRINTKVLLPPATGASVEVNNETELYERNFEFKAKLSGTVSAINASGKKYDIPVLEIVDDIEFTIKGRFMFKIQNKQLLQVS